MLAAAALTAFALLGPQAPPAGAAINYTPCGNSNNFACGHITVPLDPTGATPGTLTLALRRHRAALGEAHSAIVALAGGPGQPAVPFAEEFAELLGPIAATRDLIVFDQRGIGLSDPLACHAFENTSLYHSEGALVKACAGQLGPPRSFYTSADTVADIEAIRVAGGYEKLVLYGTSYGTKVAEEYAQTYPEHVEALVLDSVVPPNGPDPLDRATFAAVGRILRQICAGRACAHITRNPVADLARVVSRMHRHGPLRGRVLDGFGHGHTVRVNGNELLDMLVRGDFSSRLRAEFVTYVHAAANGDTAPLARLLVDTYSGEGGTGEDDDTPLYFATTCEEQQFPWSRASGPKARLAEAKRTIGSWPASATAPFEPANVLAFSDLGACAFWPYTSPSPPVQSGALPNVPTLILSGANDLRTPTSNAREVAAMIPDAHLLVAPYTGHSVLGDEPTACASNALQAMFAGKPVKPCAPAPPPAALKPPPLPPLSLAQVPPAKGYGGRPGRTLEAVLMTLSDFGRQLGSQIDSLSAGSLTSAATTLQSGGLRSGWAFIAEGTYTFHGYSFVPGVSISGKLSVGETSLHVGGSAAAHGILHMGAHHSLAGTLGGRHVVYNPPEPTAAVAIVGEDARASRNLGHGGAVVRAAVARLTRPLAGLL